MCSELQIRSRDSVAYDRCVVCGDDIPRTQPYALFLKDSPLDDHGDMICEACGRAKDRIFAGFLADVNSVGADDDEENLELRTGNS